MALYQSRNKLLLLSKKDLIKQCKKRNLNTFGCLAKMDFVQLLLASNNNNAKAKKPKMKMKIKTRKKKKKTLSLSEPIPMPSPIDPSDLNYIDFDDEDADNDILKPADDDGADVHSVQFSDLPWKLDEIKTDLKNEEEKTKGIQRWDATSISPKGSKEIITILPGFAKSKSLQTVFSELDDLKDADSDAEDEDEEDNDHHIFVQIDKALAMYYKSFQRKDYFNGKGLGKFYVYCKDKKLDDMEEFEKYFGVDTDLEPVECKYLDFDDNFPLNEYAPQPDEDEYDKEVMNKIEIYNVIEYCYHHKQSPY